MSHSDTKNRFIARNFPHYGTKEFNRRMEEGMRRAPEERAIAVKEFWSWVTRSA